MKTEIIPVIHMVNTNQVMTNIKICLNAGIKKVFLINHHVDIDALLDCALNVKTLHPELWIGVNLLGESAQDAIKRDLELDGLWCDQSITPEYAKQNRKFKGVLFGGLAFKYQPQPADLEEACKEAALITDVATTSVAATAKAADISKILTIHEYLDGHPMAIASGVSANNILSYKGLVDYLLVASSITSRSEMIYEDKLIELLELLK